MRPGSPPPGSSDGSSLTDLASYRAHYGPATACPGGTSLQVASPTTSPGPDQTESVTGSELARIWARSSVLSGTPRLPRSSRPWRVHLATQEVPFEVRWAFLEDGVERFDALVVLPFAQG